MRISARFALCFLAALTGFTASVTLHRSHRIDPVTQVSVQAATTLNMSMMPQAEADSCEGKGSACARNGDCCSRSCSGATATTDGTCN